MRRNPHPILFFILEITLSVMLVEGDIYNSKAFAGVP